jgi:hypothetical protein
MSNRVETPVEVHIPEVAEGVRSRDGFEIGCKHTVEDPNGHDDNTACTRQQLNRAVSGGQIGIRFAAGRVAAIEALH